MNVVVVLIDTLRKDHLSPYGTTQVATPNFQRLADMGTTFEQAYLTSYPCMPARRDLWTGRYEFPWRGWGPLEAGDQALPEVLSHGGVHTGLVTDHYHLFEHGSGNYQFGFDSWEFIRGQEKDPWALAAGDVTWPGLEFSKIHRGWRQYWANTRRWRDGLNWRSEEHTFAAQTFRSAATWLDANRQAEPFFLLIDCFDPHEPFDPPEPYRRRYEDQPGQERMLWPIYGPADRYSEAELRDVRGLYAGEVALVDTWLGYFMDRLERLGRLDDTMLIVTTDHGHLFGEHGMLGKPSTTHGDSNLYQEVAAVPFFVYIPGAPGGQRRQELVQLVDVYPTVLAALAREGTSPAAPLLGGEGEPGVHGDAPAWAARFGVAPERLHGHDLTPLVTGQRLPQAPPAAAGGAGTVRALTAPAPAGEGRWRREYAFYAKFGEAINVTDGRYTLFQWPPSESNAPLFWYGSQPPSFLKPRGVGDYEPCDQRYPIDWIRGPMRTALFDVTADPAQRHDLSAEQPHVLQRMQAALRDWLLAIGAPLEQLQRLGLEAAGR
ncbi:MAG TPA: sulfatase [Chloroflexota bacterium]|nr:sulfatase [Chloroflexota bacterium]